MVGNRPARPWARASRPAAPSESAEHLRKPTYARAAPPDGTTGDALRAFPRYFLLANEGLKEWHAFGMEWKEHVAWFAPLLATAVAWDLYDLTKGDDAPGIHCTPAG